MLDDVEPHDVEVFNTDLIESTPIASLTLDEIAVHMWDRFDGLALATIPRGESVPSWIALWGNPQVRQNLLNGLQGAFANGDFGDSER
jgi:hypothetical protein